MGAVTPATAATSDNISAIEAIEKALEKATPGVWDVWEEQTPNKADAIAEMAYQVENSDPFVEVVYLLNADGKCPATTGCGPTSAANAAYISACSPERMRSILAEARKAEAMEREIAAKDARIAALEAGVSDLVEIARQHVPSIPPDGPINAEHQAAYEATGFALVEIRKRARALTTEGQP